MPRLQDYIWYVGRRISAPFEAANRTREFRALATRELEERLAYMEAQRQLSLSTKEESDPVTAPRPLDDQFATHAPDASQSVNRRLQ